jgi:16S rRNA (guanine527-N7)-methyltransferase
MMEPNFGPQDFKTIAGATNKQMDDLETYRAILADWNNRMNLVGPSAMQTFWLRHAWDSAQLKFLAPEAKHWADIGAGAGFPGLVLAILMKETPGARIHLIESMSKRCRFLTEVVERLKLDATVHNARAEDVRLRGLDIVTARACAPMVRLLDFAWPTLKQGAVGLFLKGREVGLELEEARKVWSFSAEIHPSRSDASGAIVRLEGLSRA